MMNMLVSALIYKNKIHIQCEFANLTSLKSISGCYLQNQLKKSIFFHNSKSYDVDAM